MCSFLIKVAYLLENIMALASRKIIFIAISGKYCLTISKQIIFSHLRRSFSWLNYYIIYTLILGVEQDIILFSFNRVRTWS